MRILIIEDNVDAADSLKELLELYDHAVHVEYSGEQAVEVVRQFHPDVVLCDLGLPEKDGFTVAAEIRGDQPQASILMVAISGYGSDEDRVRAKSVGFDAHLTKPVDFDTLQRTLQRRT